MSSFAVASSVVFEHFVLRGILKIREATVGCGPARPLESSTASEHIRFMRRDFKHNSTQRALCERKRFTSPAQGPREPFDKSIQPKAPGNPSRNPSSPRPQGTTREIHPAQGPTGTTREIHTAQGLRNQSRNPSKGHFEGHMSRGISASHLYRGALFEGHRAATLRSRENERET